MGRRLTQEEALEVLEQMHPTIDFSEFVYVNTRTRIQVSCKTCNHNWQTTPDRLRQGKSCDRCSRRARAESRRLTQEEALAALKPKHPTIDFSEFVYTGTRGRVRVSCKTCNHSWQPAYDGLQLGHGCRKCFAERLRLTQEEALAVLEPMHPTIDFSEFVYTRANAKVRVSCKTCNHKWQPVYSNLQQGHRCPKCDIVARAESRRLTQEEALAALKPMHPTIDFSEFVYVGAEGRVRVSCKTCNHGWQPVYSTLQQGQGCKKCAIVAHAESRRLTQEEALEVLEPMHPTIDFSEFVYVSSATKSRVRCKTCDHAWETLPTNLKQGHGCPKCASSHGEKRVAEILDSRGIPYETESYLKGTRLRFDFFIPSLNVAIEVQGKQHYFSIKFFGGVETFRKVITRDRRKRQWCKDNGVKLIAIPYIKEDVSKFEQYLWSVWPVDKQPKLL